MPRHYWYFCGWFTSRNSYVNTKLDKLISFNLCFIPVTSPGIDALLKDSFELVMHFSIDFFGGKYALQLWSSGELPWGSGLRVLSWCTACVFLISGKLRCCHGSSTNLHFFTILRKSYGSIPILMTQGQFSFPIFVYVSCNNLKK